MRTSATTTVWSVLVSASLASLAFAESPATFPPVPHAAPATAPRGGPAGPAAPPSASQKAEEYYKNIQVLKGAPADQLIPAMQFISASLNVDCEHCHVDRAPEKDDLKPKQVARKMMAMTAGLNRDSFDGKREVTCATCHRGATHPVSLPPFELVASDSGETGPNPAEAPPVAPILEKYLAAVGGPQALASATSRVMTGTMTGLGPQPLPFEVHAKAPNKRLAIVHTLRGDSSTAFDGSSGWTSSSGRPPRAMSAVETEAARIDAAFRLAASLPDLFGELRVAGTETIEGRKSVHVVARNEGQPPIDLYFDSETGLLSRLVRYAETPLGRYPTRIDYADYRDAGGVKIPHRWSVSRPGSKIEYTVNEVQPNAPVDDAKFSKPAAS